MNISQKTYNKDVKKFAKDAKDNFVKLESFSKKLKLNDSQLNELCKIIDDYGIMNLNILEYAHKNDINIAHIFLDISNANF